MNSTVRRTPLLLFGILLNNASAATPWEGILDTNRAIDWSSAGVTGGIPQNRNTVCATFSPGATAAQINAQLQSAACQNKVVQLNAGTFTLNVGLDFAGHSNVTLRGAGPNQTKLIFSDNTACLGSWTHICIRSTNLSYYADSGGQEPAHVATWSSGYSKGSTSITVSNTTGLSAGMYVMLEQVNDISDTGGIYVCGTSGICVQQGSTINGRNTRGQRQLVRVTNINGSTLTITSGVYMPNFRSSQSPSVWWGNSGTMISGNGVEDLTIDATHSNGNNGSNLAFLFSSDCWAKNIRSINAPSPDSHVKIYTSAHITVRDSYFVGSQNDAGASTNYGIDMKGSCDALIENNITQHRTTALISNGDQGSVWAYNFTIDDHYDANGTAPGWMQASSYSHEIGNGMVLHESNVDVGIKADTIHGTSNLFTYFRNYSYGFEAGKTAQTNPVILHTNQRYYNFVGNVLGTAGYHNTYQAGSETSIWRLNVSYGGIPSDSVTVPSLLRWGNYDVVTGAAKFVAGEVPSAISILPNAVPSSQALPASFYLTAKPGWWPSAVPWPAIGPDVTGGAVGGTGGHVHKIPSHLCYESMTADPAYAGDPASIKVFNPSSCYSTVPVDAVPPSPPDNLRVN